MKQSENTMKKVRLKKQAVEYEFIDQRGTHTPIRLFICLGTFKHFEGVRVMVFSATFNNIAVISWQSVLLVEETRVPTENHRTVAGH